MRRLTHVFYDYGEISSSFRCQILNITPLKISLDSQCLCWISLFFGTQNSFKLHLKIKQLDNKRRVIHTPSKGLPKTPIWVCRSIDWGGEEGGNCYNQTTPIEDPNYWGSDSRKSIMEVIKEVFGKSKYPITFLNITQLSSYRRDAHTSIYKKQWSPLTPEQQANPVSYADCVHWCLPGLQDTWNELLFTKLFYPY